MKFGLLIKTKVYFRILNHSKYSYAIFNGYIILIRFVSKVLLLVLKQNSYQENSYIKNAF